MSMLQNVSLDYIAREIRAGDFGGLRGALVAAVLVLPVSLTVALFGSAVLTWPPLIVGLVALASPCIVVSLIAFAGVWTQRLPRFREGEIGMLVALGWQGDRDQQGWVEGTLDALRAEIAMRAQASFPKSENLRVAVRTLPRSTRIASNEDAQAILLKSNAGLVIWAAATAGNFSGKAGFQLGMVRTTVRHAAVDPRKKKLLAGALQDAWDSTPGFRVSRENDVVGILDIADRLALVAKYQLGLAAAVSGAFGPATTLLEEVLASGDLPRKYVARSKQELAVLYVVKWQAGQWLLPGVPAEIAEEARDAAKRSLKVLPNNSFGLRLLANSSYLLGSLDDTNHAMNLLKPIDPLGYHMNKAAMFLCENRQDAALRSYKTAQKKKAAPAMDPTGTGSAWMRAAIPEFGEQMRIGLAFLLDDSMKPEALAEYQQISAESLEPAALTFVRGRIEALTQPRGRHRSPPNRRPR